MNKPVICVDFDGVLNNYKGWKGKNELYTPRKGVREFLETLSIKYTIVIFTIRNRDKVIEWLEKYNLDIFIKEVTDIKVGAVAYIDDRGLKFNGAYVETLSELNDFKTHWEKELD